MAGPLSSERGTNKTVTASFWPWLTAVLHSFGVIPSSLESSLGGLLSPMAEGNELVRSPLASLIRITPLLGSYRRTIPRVLRWS